MSVFWETIKNYNEGTWPVQIILTIAAIVLTILLYTKQTAGRVKAMKIFLIIVSAWTSIVYYSVYCYSRNYSIAFAIFWGIVTAMWVYDLIWGKTEFIKNGGHRHIAIFLFILPFMYPFISYLRGMQFPEIASIILPCTVTVFTTAVLLAFVKEVNLYFLMMMFHWAIIGLFKAHFFNMPEDMLTALATIPALYIFFKDYIKIRKDAVIKPNIKTISILVDVICATIAIGFIFVLYYQTSIYINWL